MTILETSDLAKHYGATNAVRGVDLRVEEGEIVGLLGPNGAGKTTTISMMCGVVTPSRGWVRVAGFDLRERPFEARRAIGLVPQELALYEEITAWQNLHFFGSIYGLSGKLLAERIEWALEVAGLCDRAREPVARFSGGMKRRLNLAAGLLHHPRLLILDEPTVGVDPQSRNYIFDTIRQLRETRRMTVLYTSHYMEEVQALCERVAIMDHGEIIAVDTVDALVASHGGGAVEIEFDGDQHAISEALAAVEPPCRDVSVARRVARAIPADGYTALIGAIEGTGASVRAIRTLKPNLETVFLTLTGHSLRDD